MNTKMNKRFNDLLGRREAVQNEIVFLEGQATSPEAHIRVGAHSSLDSLYLEENYLNKDIQRLLKKQYAINFVKKIFSRS